MDYQPGILGRLADGDVPVERAYRALATARGAGATVGYVRVGFEPADLETMPATSGMAARVKGRGDALAADSPATQVDERLAPQPGDIVVRKVRIGAFGTTDLDRQLRDRGIDTLVLAGVSTSGVVLSTVRDGHDLTALHPGRPGRPGLERPAALGAATARPSGAPGSARGGTRARGGGCAAASAGDLGQLGPVLEKAAALGLAVEVGTVDGGGKGVEVAAHRDPPDSR